MSVPVLAIDLVADAGRSEEGESDLPEDNPGANDEDPAEVYRDLLEQLPQKVEFLEEHFDEVVGNGLAPGEAVEVRKSGVGIDGWQRA